MSAEDFAKNINAIVELKIGEESVNDPLVYVDKIIIVGAVQALKEFAKQEAEKAWDAGFERAMSIEDFTDRKCPSKKQYINNLFK